MKEQIDLMQNAVRQHINALYGEGSEEAYEAWEGQRSRINSLTKGDLTSDYVGRPDIQWGIILDEMSVQISEMAGNQALSGSNTHLYLIEGNVGTLVAEDLPQAV